MMSDGGKLSAELQSDTHRSKNEILFGKLCKSKFVRVIFNKRMFNGWDADIILLENKIAILWNGNWHRKKITKSHSVAQVKNRDRLKLDEIRKMGYTPYVIDDEGRYNYSFVNDEFEKLIIFIENGCVV